MNKKESKIKILNLWESWATNPNEATYNEMQKFYWWLEENHSYLLDWNVPDGTERWQDVQGWLKERIRFGK
jgi:hypothetical protein